MGGRRRAVPPCRRPPRRPFRRTAPSMMVRSASARRRTGAATGSRRRYARYLRQLSSSSNGLIAVLIITFASLAISSYDRCCRQSDIASIAFVAGRCGSTMAGARASRSRRRPKPACLAWARGRWTTSTGPTKARSNYRQESPLPDASFAPFSPDFTPRLADCHLDGSCDIDANSCVSVVSIRHRVTLTQFV